MIGDAGTLLFDADGDGDLDLYIARGGGQFPIDDERYQDVLYSNDGKGNFSETKSALPNMTSNSSVVKAADYDQDGGLDLFVGSRVLPYSYPLADRSYVLRNDSGKGRPLYRCNRHYFDPSIDARTYKRCPLDRFQ